MKFPVVFDENECFTTDLNHKYLKFRRTRIVATIGPASSSKKMLSALIKAGVNVMRINFSHGVAAEKLVAIAAIRAIAKDLGVHIAVLGDLCGPKIRVGNFTEGRATLVTGSTVIITPKAVLGTALRIPSQYRRIAEEVKPGDRILLDDGNLELKVVGVKGGEVSAKVLQGGILKDHKGMNLPDTVLKISALTAKDKKDVLTCIEAGVDFIALSFVRHERDIVELKRLLNRNGALIPVIAKIEKPEALMNIHGIIKAADGIMVARGDLGVELPAEKVPIIQKKLIKIANRHGKPVIVATQMLESMITNNRPTRAEVTDVASACLAGADAVMLSAETAAGSHPLEAVKTMDAILRETEGYQFFSLGGAFKTVASKQADQLSSAISMATTQLSKDLHVQCIFVLTRSGATAKTVSADRPAAPIMAFVPTPAIARSLMLFWGVYAFVTEHTLTIPEYISLSEKIIKNLNLAKKGDFFLLLSGMGEQFAATNSLVIREVE